MNPHVWIVDEFVDTLDSVWTTRDGAIYRAAELDRENGCEDYSYIHEVILDIPEGWDC